MEPKKCIIERKYLNKSKTNTQGYYHINRDDHLTEKLSSNNTIEALQRQSCFPTDFSLLD